MEKNYRMSDTIFYVVIENKTLLPYMHIVQVKHGEVEVSKGV